MHHLIGENFTTVCCDTYAPDLPIEDRLTVDPKKVSCGRIPIRNPKNLAEYISGLLAEAGVPGCGPWDSLDQRTQTAWEAACDRALILIDGESARPSL